jgi:hypothetical protein
METTNRINMENTLEQLDPKWKAHHVEPAKPDHFVEENFFTAEEYGAIYDVVVKTMQRGIDEKEDQWAYFLKISNNGFYILNEQKENGIMYPDSVKQKFKKKIESLVGEEVQEPGLFFARYTKEAGLPSLMPHCDKHHDRMHVTNTIQLNKTVDWDFYVEDTLYETKTNDAVWFSGSHHVHFRPDSNFTEEDYYDIFLMSSQRLADEKNPLDKAWFDTQEDLCGYFANVRYKHLFEKTKQKIYEVHGCQ